MSPEINLTKQGGRLRVLVAPLDWGLGHATRCIPIIKSLLNRGWEVVLAGEGAQKKLLEQEFPGLVFIDLAGYRIRYGTKRGLTFLKLILQAPKILIQIKRENRWLNTILARERFDLVISDNRYGLYSASVRSVFISHQLHIRTGLGRLLNHWLSKSAARYIDRFSFCWIPDFPGAGSLAGRLSAGPFFSHIPHRYIGILSRMEQMQDTKKGVGLLILLSGPEPQRTLLEEKIIRQLKDCPLSACLVRGLPDGSELLAVNTNVRIIHHLPGKELNELICGAGLVICRSGYTSIMELIPLGKKCILIPTPGQAEQEYLASYLFQERLAYAVKQDDFVLSDCLDAVRDFRFVSYQSQQKNLLETAIAEVEGQIPGHL